MENLASKYRPRTFDEIVSQEAVSMILKKQIETGKVANCYLFTGPSGTGKTTSARAFAHALNGNFNGVIEVDAASNNSVDNVRNIVASANERAIGAEYKIYILDECHVFSAQAWQAWLKCLEEPPHYTIFIFCTTNPEKIPVTILNRVQRYNLQRIPWTQIKSRLEYICSQEGFTNYTEACDYISKISKGQMRDAIAMVDKCASYSTDLDIHTVLKCLGNYAYETFFELLNSVIDDNEPRVLQIIDEYYLEGKDMRNFIDNYFEFVVEVGRYAVFKTMSLVNIPATYEDMLKNSINFDNATDFYKYYMNSVLDIKNAIKNDSNPKSTVEVLFLKMARGQ